MGLIVAFQKAVQAAGGSSTNKGWLCLSPFQGLFLHHHNQPSVLSYTGAQLSVSQKQLLPGCSQTRWLNLRARQQWVPAGGGAHTVPLRQEFPASMLPGPVKPWTSVATLHSLLINPGGVWKVSRRPGVDVYSRQQCHEEVSLPHSKML